MGTGFWIVLGIVVLVGIWLVLTYNGLVTSRNRTQEAWSEIDVELKRRHDLIPNLVNTVQGYMGHERGTLEAVTNARAAAVSAGAPGDPAQIRADQEKVWPRPRAPVPLAQEKPSLQPGSLL